MRKRVLALVITLAMLMSISPVADNEPLPENEESDNVFVISNFLDEVAGLAGDGDVEDLSDDVSDEAILPGDDLEEGVEAEGSEEEAVEAVEAEGSDEAEEEDSVVLYPAAGEYTIEGDGVYVEVDDNMYVTFYRVEEDGTKTLMTHRPEPINPTALPPIAALAWENELPWSVGFGTSNNDFNTGSAKLVSDSSGYVTTGVRSIGPSGVAGYELAVDDFVVSSAVNTANVETYFGSGDRLTVTGKSDTLNLTRILVIETSRKNPGVVSISSQYRYDGVGTLEIARFVENNYKIYDPLPAGDYLSGHREAGLWTQQGATLIHGRDYTMPVFNTMGVRPTTRMNMERCNQNDLISRNNWYWGENGGLPFNDFYGTTVGIFIGSAMPYQIRGMELPTRGSAIAGEHDTAYTWLGWPGRTLEAGELTDVGVSIVGVHTGDFYNANRQFAQAMAYIPSLEETGIGMESSVAADWLALPDTSTYPDYSWMNTWESWGGNEGFDPTKAMDWADDGTFAAVGVKYLILDAGWYPRGTIPRGGASMEMCQRGGEGGYIVQPYKWAGVAERLGMDCETEADAMKVVKGFTDYLHDRGFKVCAWVMPSSVYLFPSDDDNGWNEGMGVTFAEAGAVRDPASIRNLAIDTEFTRAHPDYLATANEALYNPVTGELLPGSPRPYYMRQCGYYPQTGTADLCLGNPRVMTEYVDYFCNLMFDEYGFDGLKIDTQWGAQACYAKGHGHDDDPEAGIKNYALYWKKIYDKAKEILGEEPWIKHCCCGTMMNFFNNNGTNRPIAGDAGSNAKKRYSNRMWKGLYGDNAPAVSDSANSASMRNMHGAGLVLETMMYDPTAATWPNDYQKWFYTMSVEEGLSSANYLDLYKYGFDYPEAYAFDKPEEQTKYFSFYATRNDIEGYLGGLSSNATPLMLRRDLLNTLELGMAYEGEVELRGLQPGKMYTVLEYVDNTYIKDHIADEDGVITLDLASHDFDAAGNKFTEVLLLKAIEKEEGPYQFEGNGIYVEVDEDMSMTVYRVEEDGEKTAMTQKPEPIVPTALSAGAQAAWSGKLPWSVGTSYDKETDNKNFDAGSAKLLSDKSGYVTTGKRSDGTEGDEVAIDDFSVSDVAFETDVETYFGDGNRMTVTGLSASLNLKRILVIETSKRNPGVISVTSKYLNQSGADLDIARFIENNYKIYDPLPAGQYLEEHREAGLWTQQGQTLVHGRDYTFPVFNIFGTMRTAMLNQERIDQEDDGNDDDLISRNNWFWGENGGLPFNDFYGSNVGILIGSAMPHQIRGLELPTRGSGIEGKHDTAYTWVGWPGRTLRRAELTTVGTSIVGVHSGDFYMANRQFAQAMAYIPSLVDTGIGMESSVPADWLATPDTSTYPDYSWMNTWESWGGNEGFDPTRAMDWADDGTFASMGIKYLILDAGWYPRGTIARGGATMEMCQRGGEGGYIVQPYKWEGVADRLGLPCKTEEDAMKVVKAFTTYLHNKGFKVCAWVMPSSVFLFPSGDDTGWEANMGISYDQAGATVDPNNKRNINISTAFTEAHPDYLVTANEALYDPETGELLPGSPAPYYVRQCGYYPQSGTADLCLGNPRVMTEYVDYFCNLMFEEYGFDGLKIDTQWGAQACYAKGHGHDDNPEAGIANYALYWKKIYDKAKEILGEEPWIKHCCCGTMMNFFNNNGTNRPIAGDAGSNAKKRYSNRMWKGLYGDNAPAVSDSANRTSMRGMHGAGLVLETMMYNPTNASWPNDYQKWFYSMSVKEGLSSANYLDLYKYGFDYPEAYAFDKPEEQTKYFSFFATRNDVEGYFGSLADHGEALRRDLLNNLELEMTYEGEVELRGLEPKEYYRIYDYSHYVDEEGEGEGIGEGKGEGEGEGEGIGGEGRGEEGRGEELEAGEDADLIIEADEYGISTIYTEFTEVLLLKAIQVQAHSVIFIVDGDIYSDIYTIHGNPLLRPEDPIKSGYTFAGWYQDMGLTQYWSFDNPVISEMTLYARWMIFTAPTPSPPPKVSYGGSQLKGAVPVATPTPTPTEAPGEEPGEETSGEPTPTTTPSPLPTPTQPSRPQSSMTDIAPDYWAVEFIDGLAARGIIDGYPMPDGSREYRPENDITRLEMAKLIVASLELELIYGYDGSDTFADWVDVQEWGRPYMAAAIEAGIVLGSVEEDGLYLFPKNNIIREEMIAMCARALGAETPVGGESDAPDFDTVSEWAMDSVAFAVENGMINLRQGNVAPGANATRSEAAMILYKLMEYLGL
ncbi:MAG: S-layer homology domain-containing protein [Oscillospiraceae bacterium]|nr:S-layer homology domain-containing protein [Oscillospiraceae bacterium]